MNSHVQPVLSGQIKHELCGNHVREHHISALRREFRVGHAGLEPAVLDQKSLVVHRDDRAVPAIPAQPSRDAERREVYILDREVRAVLHVEIPDNTIAAADRHGDCQPVKAICEHRGVVAVFRARVGSCRVKYHRSAVFVPETDAEQRRGVSCHLASVERNVSDSREIIGETERKCICFNKHFSYLLQIRNLYDIIIAYN